MKNLSKLMPLFVAAAVVFCPIAVKAATLDFDTLSAADPIPDGYGGVNWDGIGILNVAFSYPQNPPVAGYGYALISPDNVAVAFGAPSSFSSATTFDFNSVYLTAAFRDGLSITVAGFNNGSQLYTSTILIDSTAPTLAVFNYLGVDTVSFTTSGGVLHGYPGAGAAECGDGCNQFALDNLTLNATAVPEPSQVSGLLLAGLGVVGGGLIRRRKSLAGNEDLNSEVD